MGVRQFQLLVALSLSLAHNALSAVDQHKQPPVQMRGKVRRFLAFAYTSGRLTSEGKKPIAGTTIAADPTILPMGSKVRITGAGGYSGTYLVSDRGGSIKGRKIDIFVSNLAEARQFGRKQVDVEILEVPPMKASNSRSTAKTTARSKGCGQKRSDAIIASSEATGSNGDISRANDPANGVGARARRGDSGQAGDTEAIAGLSAIEGTPSN